MPTVSLPAQFHFLDTLEGVPKMLKIAREYVGVTEISGKKNNPVIIGWANDVGLTPVYTDDDIPWCGLFMAVCAQRAGWRFPEGPLWALNWRKFGREVPLEEMSLGDVIVLKRELPNGGVAGHVGQYVGENETHVALLGGNQSNAVNIRWFPKSRIVAARRAIWRVEQPAAVKPVILGPTGPVSASEQ